MDLRTVDQPSEGTAARGGVGLDERTDVASGNGHPADADYQPVAATSLIISERLCEAVELRPGSRVLDVGTGTGNTALAAARRSCRAVGLDLDPAGLPRAATRADAEGLEVSFVVGDAVRLPFPAGSFDAVLSTLAIIFADDQPAAADELLRVCRPGGVIGLANWSPDGWNAAFFELLRRHTWPDRGPVPAARSPFRWGSEDGLRSLLGDRIADLRVIPRSFHARHPSAASYWQLCQDSSGFVQERLEAVTPDVRDQIAVEVHDLIQRFNESDDDTLVIAQDYVEVVAVKR